MDRFYADILGFSEIWRGGSTDAVTSWINMKTPDGAEYIEYMLVGADPLTRSRLGSMHHVAIVIDELLYLKVDAQTRAAFEAEGCEPFVYEVKGKAVPMNYWSVPEAALDSPQEFRPWAQRAWEAALRKPKPTPRKRAAGRNSSPPCTRTWPCPRHA